MSVLIKGMEMPPNCSECAFCGYYGNKTHLCDINQQEIDYDEMLENRRDDCPLVPVPPHGDLIDRYDLKNKEITIDYDKWDDCFDDGVLFVTDLIDNAPTIIPAEPPKEEA